MKSQDIRQSPTDIFQTQPSPMPEEAPFDLSSSASTIPPAQKQKETTVSWSSHCVNKKSPCDYARDRVEKYEKYFKDGEILPIPELVEAVEPKTLSFVVTYHARPLISFYPCRLGSLPHLGYVRLVSGSFAPENSRPPIL